MVRYTCSKELWAVFLLYYQLRCYNDEDIFNFFFLTFFSIVLFRFQHIMQNTSCERKFSGPFVTQFHVYITHQHFLSLFGCFYAYKFLSGYKIPSFLHTSILLYLSFKFQRFIFFKHINSRYPRFLLEFKHELKEAFTIQHTHYSAIIHVFVIGVQLQKIENILLDNPTNDLYKVHKLLYAKHVMVENL